MTKNDKFVNYEWIKACIAFIEHRRYYKNRRMQPNRFIAPVLQIRYLGEHQTFHRTGFSSLYMVRLEELGYTMDNPTYSHCYATRTTIQPGDYYKYMRHADKSKLRWAKHKRRIKPRKFS